MNSLALLMLEGVKLKKAAETWDRDIYDFNTAWLLFQWGHTSAITSLSQQITTSEHYL